MLDSLFLYRINYLSKMIPWKFRKDWFRTDLENWFGKVEKNTDFWKSQKNSAEMAKVTIFFIYFLNTIILRNAGMGELGNFVKNVRITAP
jgi:hypothetical protein